MNNLITIVFKDEYHADKILPNEAYCRKCDLDVDERGKIAGIIENPYDFYGHRKASWVFREKGSLSGNVDQ